MRHSVESWDARALQTCVTTQMPDICRIARKDEIGSTLADLRFSEPLWTVMF